MSYSKDHLYDPMGVNVDEMVKLVNEMPNNNLRFVVFVKRGEDKQDQSDFYGTRIYEISKEALNESHRQQPIKLVKQMPFETDSGSADSMREFLVWAFEHYSAERYGCITSGHGVPWNRSGTLGGSPYKFCPDTANHSTIPTHHLHSRILNNIPGFRKFEVVVMDNCCSASIELVTEWSRYARYFVGSESTVPKQGFRYDTSLGLFKNTDSPSGKEIACSFVDNRRPNIPTISAIDCGRIIPLTMALKEWAMALRNLNEFGYNIQLTSLRNIGPKYDDNPRNGRTTRDIGYMAKSAMSTFRHLPQAKATSEKVNNELERAVVANYCRGNYLFSSGLSIEFMKGIQYTYNSDYSISPRLHYPRLLFDQMSDWSYWLKIAP